MVDRDGTESATSWRANDWSSVGVTQDCAAAADGVAGPSLMRWMDAFVGSGPQSSSFWEIRNGMLGLRIVIVLFFWKPKQPIEWTLILAMSSSNIHGLLVTMMELEWNKWRNILYVNEKEEKNIILDDEELFIFIIPSLQHG